VKRFRPSFDKTAKIVEVAVSPQKPGLADYRYTSDRPLFQVSARNFFRFFPDFRDFQEKISATFAKEF